MYVTGKKNLAFCAVFMWPGSDETPKSACRGSIGVCVGEHCAANPLLFCCRFNLRGQGCGVREKVVSFGCFLAVFSTSVA